MGYRPDIRAELIANMPPPTDMVPQSFPPVVRLLLATAPISQPLAMVRPEQRGGSGARSSGSNDPPGTTVVTPEPRGCSEGRSSGDNNQPRPVVRPEPRCSIARQISVWQYVKNVRHGWRPRAILSQTRTARIWTIVKFCKDRKYPRCLGRLCKAYIADRHRYICPMCKSSPVCLKCRTASIIDDMCTCPLRRWK